jgi:hypothetical protein
MSIVLQGSTSGSITLQEPAVAGTNTISLPASTGTVALTSDVVGVGQTWQDVSGSRTAGTTYTNDTGKPICFLMSFGANSGANDYITLTIDGTAIPFIYAVNVDGVVFGQNMAIIPVGATYSYAQLTSVTKSIYELR